MTRTPTPEALRGFAILAALYAGLVLAVLPWASIAGPPLPRVILACDSAIAVADLLTAMLLAREYLRDPRPAFLLLACAYAYSTVLALLHLAVFPGALFPQRPFGSAQVTAWMFLFWRTGTAVLFLAAIAAARRPAQAGPAGRRLALALLATAATCAIAATAAATLQAAVTAGTRFTPLNLAIIIAYEVICIAGLAMIWRARAFGDRLYLWLALVLAANVADQLVGSFSGGQYTLGWHVAKASTAVSAFILLVCWLVAEEDGARELAGPRAYLAAAGAMAAALFLRWFLMPWVGPATPFATLFGAVAIAVWVGGWKPAALAAAVGYAVAVVAFQGAHPLSVESAISGVLYWISCVFIIGLGAAMRDARNRYSAANANKSHFLAVLSHELRNPLAPIVNGLALLQASEDRAANARTRAMMERQLNHLRRLIDDLLDMSRIDQGKLHLRRERAAVESIVRNAVDAARPYAEAKRQELAVRSTDEALAVDGDAVRLSQVLANLLHNASKFTPERGGITLDVAREGTMVVFSVTDSGIGFTREEAQRIFEVFVQLDRGIAHTAGGLGLGLALVRSIVHMHGGSVEASSAGPGAGATFTVRLPLLESGY